MTSQELKNNICRLCLDESVVLDWNAILYGYSDITYKDCFYKYTQLECLASDTFSTMLCQICVDGLYNTHNLILKALESHEYLQQTNCTTNIMIDHSTNLDDIKYTTEEFETILLEKIKVEPIIQDRFVYENSDTEPIKISKHRGNATATRKQQKKCKNKIEAAKRENKSQESVVKTFNNSLKESLEKSHRKTAETLTKPIIDHHNNITDNQKKQIGILDDLNKDSDSQQESKKERKKYKELKKERMCSICSKLLHNIYAVRMHEKTHIKNRERKETCKICGLKFYDKRNLYTHNRIHDENREKIHKCEFCNKSFYNKGGLNIHRRIHLDQMIPCSLCTKKFFRQIDLDRHMSTHSATTINTDLKKRSRYFVLCKHCGKSILSTSFKSHTAAHLNDPLMKCSICNKDFFHRSSCVVHVKKVHKKTNEDYNDFIVQLKKDRISHLFLEQKADIQITDE